MLFAKLGTYDFSQDPLCKQYWKTDFLLAFLLWFSAVHFLVSLYLVIPIFLLIFVILLVQRRIVFHGQFWALAGIFLLSTVNMILGMFLFNVYPESTIYYVPRLLFIPLVFLLGSSFSPQIFKYFMLIVFVEYCFAFLQQLGLFPIFTETVINPDSGLMYAKRTTGFSYGSSTLGIRHYFIVLIYVCFYEKYKKLLLSKWIFLFGFFIGLITSFNRSAFVALPCFFALFAFKHLKISLLLKPQNMAFILLATGVFLSLGTFISDFIQQQLLRGFDDANSISSGRVEVFEAAWEFIKKNPVFGMFSNRYKDQSAMDVVHSHNSFLQCMADHGIPIFLLVLATYVSLINKNNIAYAVSIGVFCLLNYVAFWGCSQYDLMIFYLLTQDKFCSKTVKYQESLVKT